MIKALKDFVLVRQEYAKESGGIVIPETAVKFKKYDGSIRYIVVSVGPECPYELKEGDIIEIMKHEGIRFVYEGIEYWKVKERWILGKYLEND